MKFDSSAQPSSSAFEVLKAQVDKTLNSDFDICDVPSERDFAARMVRTGVIILIIAVAIAAGFTWHSTRNFAPEIHAHAVRTAILLPLIIVPICCGIIGFLGWLNHRRMLEVARLARTDHMTGLANRRTFMLAAQSAFQSIDLERSGLSLFIIDLDHFKQVNDVHGHHVGDEVLIHAANQIVKGAPRDGLVARLGGEEFAIIVPYLSVAELHQKAEAIRHQVESVPCTYNDLSIQISASVGVGVANTRDSVGSAMSRADNALYEAKDQGRNRFVIAA